MSRPSTQHIRIESLPKVNKYLAKQFFIQFIFTKSFHRRELSIPLMEPDFLGGPATFDRCQMYDIDYDRFVDSAESEELRPNSSSWRTVKCQNGWDYDLKQTRYSTIVSEVYKISNQLFLAE